MTKSKYGTRQSAPANQKHKYITNTFWRRHPTPFAKRMVGHARRMERLWKAAISGRLGRAAHHD